MLENEKVSKKEENIIESGLCECSNEASCNCETKENTNECSCDNVEAYKTPSPLPNDYFKKSVLSEDPAEIKGFAKEFEEKKRSEFIKSQLENIQVRETISFDMDEDISNAIRFLSIKVNSYSNLFATYMNSSAAATPNSTVLDSFLEKFTAVNVEIEDFKIKNCKKILGEEGYEYLINNPFRYNFNFDTNKLQITRLGNNNIKCSCSK